MKTLQFYPFKSLAQSNFWDTLSKNKLNDYKLDDSQVKLLGCYRNDDVLGFPPLLRIDYNSFNLNQSEEANSYFMNGTLFLFNTIEEFKKSDKNQLINDIGKKMWYAMNTYDLSDPNQDLSKILSVFILLVYPDLKKYKFYQWFAFPALSFDQFEPQSDPPIPLKDQWSLEMIEQLSFKYSNCLTSNHKSYFLTTLNVTTKQIEVYPLTEFNKWINKENIQLFLSFADPCAKPNFPGWPLRNFLVFAYLHFKQTDYKVLCYRVNKASVATESIILTVNIKCNTSLEYSSCVGWDKNEKQDLCPYVVDLSSSLNPKKLASNAIDLNLKLMKWRLMPNLDLEKLCSTKCLILGAGTLGCNVARTLMGWGIKYISFVDSSRVSYSNPVRQSLYDFDDCLNSGKFKSKAAASKLNEIFPYIQSKGHVLTIPMPGHSVFANSSSVKKDIELLEDLIESYDCIFLLTDTRESRWLPTVIGQLKRKIVINAALGFDTYLVQRHGIPSDNPNYSKKLGCYFCNDVVAPGDSTKNRTLDQQCTVTRPGVSMIAASLAVELLISVLQFDSDIKDLNASQSADLIGESSLGLVPHQIRGFVSQFTQLTPTTYAFDRCTACSPIILDAYKKHKFNFLEKVFQDSNYLEELTGLKSLQEDINIDDVWALSDEES